MHRKRTEVWKHNSFLGFAKTMEIHAKSIISSATATDKSKNLAHKIANLAIELSASLRERKDYD